MTKWIIEYFDEMAGLWKLFEDKNLVIDTYETAWKFIQVTIEGAHSPKFRAVNVETKQVIDGELVKHPAKVYSH